MNYGDSTTGTFASGPVGKDVATIAGISILDQEFAAINDTTNPTVEFGAAGIFGLGFPGERCRTLFPLTSLHSHIYADIASSDIQDAVVNLNVLHFICIRYGV